MLPQSLTVGVCEVLEGLCLWVPNARRSHACAHVQTVVFPGPVDESSRVPLTHTFHCQREERCVLVSRMGAPAPPGQPITCTVALLQGWHRGSLSLTWRPCVTLRQCSPLSHRVRSPCPAPHLRTGSISETGRLSHLVSTVCSTC